MNPSQEEKDFKINLSQTEISTFYKQNRIPAAKFKILDTESLAAITKKTPIFYGTALPNPILEGSPLCY